MTVHLRVSSQRCSLTLREDGTVVLRDPERSHDFGSLPSAKTSASSLFDDPHRRVLLDLVERVTAARKTLTSKP